MSNLNKKDLKFKIEELYNEIIDQGDSHLIIGLDTVKSILGIDINKINPRILYWYTEHLPNIKAKNKTEDKLDIIPEAISFFSLETYLLKRNYAESLKAVHHLSRVSEGRQVLEFLLEFSLKYTKQSYRSIWHIYRLQIFLNGKTMLRSLNRCIELILNNKKYIQLEDISSKQNLVWSKYLCLKIDDISNLFLLYTIYNTELIRSHSLKKIILARLYEIDLNKIDKINSINIRQNQTLLGRKWILNFINNYNELNFNILELLNNARGAVMLSGNSDETNYIWTQLNKKICD
jgi:hypothetical protein